MRAGSLPAAGLPEKSTPLKIGGKNMFELTYKNGKGRLSINLEELLPCSKADFKRLLDTIELSDTPDKYATEIYMHIVDHINELKERREKVDPEYHKKDIAAINAELKKYLGLSGMLTKCYDMPELNDKDATITLRPAIVYALHQNSETGEAYAARLDGWTFNKSGYDFEVYRSDIMKEYVVLVPGTGLKITSAPTKNQVAASITPHIIEIINEQTEKIMEAREQLKAYMIKAGYIEADPEPETENDTANENKGEDTMKNTTNENYFEHIQTLDALRTKYRDLLKENHPDNGGSDEIMKEINVQYAEAFAFLKASATAGTAAGSEQKEDIKWSEAEDAAIREALSKIIYLEGLNIEIVGCWIWVDGNTFPNRNELKEAGYKWSKARQKWHYAPYEKKFYKGSKKSFEQIRREYGSEHVASEERATIAS
jgi:hypothetical protein